MKRFDHLIVGGGMAGYAAATAIRHADRDATIGMFSEEPEGPYDRTALSKGLWRDKTEAEIRYDLRSLGVELIPRRATRIEPAPQLVHAQSGDTASYGKLLLSTGVRPRFLPFELESVYYLHSIEQYRQIRSEADLGKSFLVIGGGFLGAELAAALNMKGNEVTMVFPEAGIGGLIFPADLAAHLTEDFSRRGIDVKPNRKVSYLAQAPGARVLVTLNEGQLLEVDRVIVAIGATPQSDMAWVAGIATGDGILVDEYFRTDTPNVYAAGDAANYPDPILGRRRVEHEDHAVQSGRHAGMAMAGQPTPYHHMPLFFSDLFDYGYEAVGNLSPDLRTLSQWEERYEKGIIYYLDDASLVRGVLLWNTWGLADKARRLIAMGARSAGQSLQLGEAV